MLKCRDAVGPDRHAVNSAGTHREYQSYLEFNIQEWGPGGSGLTPQLRGTIMDAYMVPDKELVL
jgi:hypothetical protein